jgi:hypothetical protein
MCNFTDLYSDVQLESRLGHRVQGDVSWFSAVPLGKYLNC